MSTAQNKETVRQIFDALAKGDPSAFSQAVHPDYTWRLAGHSTWSRRFHGQKEIQNRFLAPLFALFSSAFRASAVKIIAEGDYVVAEARGNVQTKRGDTYNNEYCYVFRFRNLRIDQVVEYCDTDLAERVLGSYEDAVSDFTGGLERTP